MNQRRVIGYVFIAAIVGACAVVPQLNLPPTQLGDPLPNLTPEERMRFDKGRIVFARVFTPETGLGPQFNAPSCASCHQLPVLGGEGQRVEEEDAEVHATRQRPDRSCDMLVEQDGPVFRKQTTDGSAPRHPPVDAQIGQRSTPPVFGMGLLDGVPDRPAGRFGRKNQERTLADFTRGAFATEQGVEVPSELSQADLDLAIDFLRFLAPAPPLPLTAQARHGQHLFRAIGCAECHTPTLQTGYSTSAALSRRLLHPYTDLLLHRMGPRLTDICFFNARAEEFRTAPLWGTRFRTHLLHDGRATNVGDAVAYHGGEAARARKAFTSLTIEEQAALVAFVNSL